MRLGVLDVGSNTVHLLVMDAHPGARPLPAYSHKAELRLAELLDGHGAISEAGVDRLVTTVADAVRVAEDKGVEDVLPFATSAVREAANGEEVLARVERETGVRLTVLSGEDESRLTFLAVRRWFGWSAGRLLVLDIGGGSLEVGFGMDEYPAAAVSLPLGAGRLTGAWLPGDPPSHHDVRALRRQVRAEIARTVTDFARLGSPDLTVGTSKTFRQLARIAGAARSAEGLYVQRTLRRSALEEWVPKLAGMTAARRAALPGVSEGRARQLLAGALVAEGAMDLFGVDELEICPWALREGVILRKLDVMVTEPAKPAVTRDTPPAPPDTVAEHADAVSTVAPAPTRRWRRGTP
ncbi:exopolyphosphatase / guanosine-5'-triphosphate,3'-diphosphate pyrophosphatase [Streptomyces sp. DvalAA-14]|uniref:Ppx/GppA phosphatase family protein n=1 Tax=unclassified Streptomyces TaxID=2593676 RepID=UPI00081B6148|nr:MULTISPECIES: Ppx/GppA phosphatase family protein [unclassified Streptomyces]MYS19119.1 Ppx/GppA family phosphatase [Streptomyces sp. SID4948]SCD37085.1 exopolyphosphatase / guanosine-5'-triphosphate,3'-diphosphate pyrophosphatase [Streptomyces sp. DvalAA-14]